MKKYVIGLLLHGICTLAVAQSVGIKTTNPTGVFHIDGGGNNSPSPTAAEFADDVMISNNGWIGIGTLTPQAKLSVVTNSSTPYALQVIDGNQLTGKLLTSDVSGNALWMPTPVASTGKIEATLLLGPQQLPVGPTTAIPTSWFVVKTDGYHVCEIRWYATYSGTYVKQTYTATHLRLFKNGVVVDEYEAYEDLLPNNADAVTFFTSLAVSAKVGDVLTIDVRPGIGPSGNLLLTKNTDLTTSKMIVKRLNIN